MVNISKTREFPENMYDLYKLNKDERGKYLNTWFPRKRINKVQHRKHINNKKEYISSDKMGTLVEVDEDTSWRLYGIKFNPIILSIYPHLSPWKDGDSYGVDRYDICSSINSIDDSSYTIWIIDKPFKELEELRLKVMEWVGEQELVNGDEFIKYCVSSGFDKSTVDYN